MTNDEEKKTCIQFLKDLRAKKDVHSKFEESVNVLRNYAASKGLEDKDINLLANVIVNANLPARKLISLVKCLVPRYKVPKDVAKLIITWCLSSVDKMPITVCIITMQWITGVLDYQLIDKNIVHIYYSVFFYIMLRKQNLEKHIARIIYVLARPEDITRRDVSRLLNIHQKYSRVQKHVTALLSLFKSYKPELVPENIQSINIGSAWKVIPEVLRLMFEDAKARSEVQHTECSPLEYFNQNTFPFQKMNKNMAPLLPSVRYFQIGSSIFKPMDTKSIFDISSIQKLGKLHLNIELPSGAISLLANTIGYHLLTFTNFHYQSRFSYNLYNTLMRALILENEKYSEEEITKLLDMTIEFSRYMQQGIPVVNRFLDNYLYLNTGEYQSQLLTLLQWMTSVSTSDLQERILVHVRNIYSQSTIITKCEIIRTLKMLITNLFVNQGFEESYQRTLAPFLGQGPMNTLEETISVLVEASQEMIESGLNIHSYNILLLSEALSFYEELCLLESQNNTILFFTIPPSTVIYGSFITTNCVILSRICKLLFRYHNRILEFKDTKIKFLFKKIIQAVSFNVQTIVEALWYNEKPSEEHNNIYVLRNIPNTVMKDVEHCNINCFLNINNHYAILPYKCILNKTGLDVNTKEDAMYVALHYYPNVYEFLNIFQDLQINIATD